VFAGDGIRTLRRGFADILFSDTSEIRLNERSDLVLEDSNTMRRYALTEGAIWVRVAKGERTVVRTPVGTATARGTVFTISANGVLTVLEGSVQFDVGGSTTIVHAGQTATFDPQANTFNTAQTNFDITQPNTGYTDNGWFDHPGGNPYETVDLSPVDGATRQYALFGDATPAGGAVTGTDLLSGLGALAGAGAIIGADGSRGALAQPLPEPGVVPGLLVGIGGLAFFTRRRRR